MSRGLADLLGEGRTLKDIVTFRRELTYFDDLQMGEDQNELTFGDQGYYGEVRSSNASAVTVGAAAVENLVNHANYAAAAKYSTGKKNKTVSKLEILKGLLHTKDGPRLAANDGGCFISNENTGRYRFESVSVREVVRCEPTVAGEQAYAWVSPNVIQVCVARLVGGEMYKVDRYKLLKIFNTRVLVSNTDAHYA